MADSIDQVKDPVAQAKMRSIQDHVTELDKEIISLRGAMGLKRATAEAFQVASGRIFKECDVVQRKIDEQGMSLDEGRAEISVIKRCSNILGGMAEEAQGDLLKHQGKIIGLEHSVKVARKRFEDLSAKYERWERQQEDDDGYQPPSVRAKAKKKKSKAKATRKKKR